MADGTIVQYGLEIASRPAAPASGSGETTMQLGDRQIRLTWKDGEIETAEAQGGEVETKMFRVGAIAPDDGGVEEACIHCWRVGGGPWRCIPITCPPTI